MKIAVIGAGAIGSLVAGYLTKAGEDVLLVCKEDYVNAISKNGLIITGVRGNENIKVKVAVKMTEECDLVIFATKTQDLGNAYQENHLFLENCMALTTQNGVQSDNILSTHFERNKMFSSIVMFGSTLSEPGKVVFNFEGDWIIGKPFMPVEPQVHDLAKIFEKAFPVKVSQNITGMKWLKLFINFNNCIPAMIGKSMQETFADMDLCRLSILLLKEGLKVVESSNIEIISLPNFPAERIYGMTQMPIDQAAGIINKTLTTLSKEPLFGSILQSIQRGKISEIDFINGEVVHLGKQTRVEAPLNERALDMVHQVERTGRFFSVMEIKKEFELIEYIKT